MPYGDRFKKQRKCLQDALMPKPVLLSYRPMQRRETYTLLQGLCESPERVNDHIKRYSILFLTSSRIITVEGLLCTANGADHVILCR